MQVKQIGISNTSFSLSLIGSHKGYAWVHILAESVCAKAVCAGKLCFVLLHLPFYIFCLWCGPRWKILI